ANGPSGERQAPGCAALLLLQYTPRVRRLHPCAQKALGQSQRGRLALGRQGRLR
ncbi:unnamed protein product, partial [Heterosigma akashiwo]